MNKLYQSPLRVYLALGALALWGIIAGFQLPISLFPNSSKPSIVVNLGYGQMSANEFLNTYGRNLESSLQAVADKDATVEQVKSSYAPGTVRYRLQFKWGNDERKALTLVQNIMSSFVAQMTTEVRNSLEVWSWSDSGGFIAVSFYSKTRTLDQLYHFLEPQLMPQVHRVADVSEAWMWNPNQKEVRIALNPEKTALLEVFPRDVSESLLPQLEAYRGGGISEGINQLNVEMPPLLRTVEDLKQAVVPARTGAMVHLSDIASIDYGTPSTNSRSLKTSGVPSLILEAQPKPGGNVKRMAEDILAVVDKARAKWPSDIEYKVLVDPSEFIRSAVSNVIREVAVAAMLAVVVLFLFIGNIRNVATAAIEIPLSIVLAFILMKMTGINLNLISLGGLALSAGMNVDGSVVVMENIFRHFDMASGPLTYKDRVRIISEAVSEVRFPIIASTIASLVVFIPLAFTSKLTNAILGDLAMAVVYSHGCSAIVSLILVPTVRLQLMSRGNEKSSHSFLEPVLRAIESGYARCLEIFLARKALKLSIYAGLSVVLAILGLTVLQKLPREVVGKPDTDWLVLSANTRGNTLIRQMDSASEMIENRLLEKFGDSIAYTFTQTFNPNGTSIMARLKDKSKVHDLWVKWEAEFANTPDIKYTITPWNPSELQIPDPPNFELSVRGNEVEDRIAVARALNDELNDAQAFPRISTTPDLSRLEVVNFIPSPEQWSNLEVSKARLTPSDVADVARTATQGKRIWQMPVGGEIVPITLDYGDQKFDSVDLLASFPVGVLGKLVPLKALTRVERTSAPVENYREDGTDRVMITGQVTKGEESQIATSTKKANELIEKWKKENSDKHSSVVTIEDSNRELTEALNQLAWAVGLSVILIFITMVFQFGDIVNAVLVLVAIPLGFIGVLISLFVFRSTLSLNSVLGVILLNGIAVANSIILVDFLKRLVERGRSPTEAALEAARARLRPILMTSLTTGLGMLPVALGFGEGGKILQPLGIAVIGGLVFSMATTLFIVPSLQVSYLNWKLRRHNNFASMIPTHPAGAAATGYSTTSVRHRDINT